MAAQATFFIAFLFKPTTCRPACSAEPGWASRRRDAIAAANRIAAATALSLPERIHVTFPKVPWDQPATLIVSAWRGMAS
jgi:hypothetical protein